MCRCYTASSLFILQGQASTLGMTVDAAPRPRRFPMKGILNAPTETGRFFCFSSQVMLNSIRVYPNRGCSIHRGSTIFMVFFILRGANQRMGWESQAAWRTFVLDGVGRFTGGAERHSTANDILSRQHDYEYTCRKLLTSEESLADHC